MENKDSYSLYEITKKYFGESSVSGLSKEEWEAKLVNSYDKPVSEETKKKFEEIAKRFEGREAFPASNERARQILKNIVINKMTEELNLTDIKKDLYKSKVDATLQHYDKGKLIYNVTIGDSVYQFPIHTVENTTENWVVASPSGPLTKEIKTIKLSDDLGETKMETVIPGRLLIRYIEKAIKEDTFVFLYKKQD